MTFFWWLVIIVAAALALWYAYSRTPVVRRSPGGEGRRDAAGVGDAGPNGKGDRHTSFIPEFFPRLGGTGRTDARVTGGAGPAGREARAADARPEGSAAPAPDPGHLAAGTATGAGGPPVTPLPGNEDQAPRRS
ncbi:hypothetical protein [Caldinitratiruptor microaerophilus]|uniref:Uncharacterized protein n=1 Tax=Caldinitratiruptor microaerophilus TaxID=671077 RepID=A0AA35CL22_9FIRM|nr:hypothetical protein [Caldinitratiruptor microaerophilus]BDG61275.1 hypothetical protein caldi_23650 [Caldinitratiruptor microaerophilus]